MTTKNQTPNPENASRRDFIIKGTMLGGGLMLGIGALPELALAQAGTKYDPNTPTQAGEAEVNALSLIHI